MSPTQEVASLSLDEEIAAWDRAETLYATQERILVPVVSVVKGGVIVDIGLPAFLPGRMMATGKPVPGCQDAMIGTKVKVVVSSYNRSARSIVVSGVEETHEEFLERCGHISPDPDSYSTIDATVLSVMPYGVFLKASGVVGLLHKSEISWGKNDQAPLGFSPGQVVRVAVLPFGKSCRVCFTTKDPNDSPLLVASRHAETRESQDAIVVGALPFGLRVEINGAHSMIHHSKLEGAPLAELVPVRSVAEEDREEARKIMKGRSRDNTMELLRRYPIGTVLSVVIDSVDIDAERIDCSLSR
jgi:small subunit ribosomal protein S1